MTGGPRDVDGPADSVGERTCPAWCRTLHGVSEGEDDWLHVSEPLVVSDDVTARLCMSVDPRTHEADGPYVLVGSREYSLADAEQLGERLIELTATAASVTPRSAA
ncbi:DUF6907 domain-containing protein [Microbacterium sp. E-13]|uniref:DUF6907 domain-containing protein n=1 Tax=Microbacterium sp. E-13 TaxID=3404048 RepID=UPI003CF431F0